MTRIHSIALFALLLMMSACEVIPEAERLIPVEQEGPHMTRTHLLIEYTGFRCVNCPTAAQTAHEMTEIYGENLIVVAMHPASNPFTKGKYDYTCPEADTCYVWMGGTATTPFPTGNIDLTVSDNTYFFDPVNWMAQLNRAMSDTVAPYLTIHAALDTTLLTVTATVETYADAPLEARLAIWLIEDSVPGVQAMPDGSVNTEYIHRHILRAASEDGLWGTPIRITDALDSCSVSMPLPTVCDPDHCELIALLLDPTDRHVIQLKKSQITNHKS